MISLTKLLHLLKELENNIPNQDSTNLLVSKSTVGWHIEHTLLTLNLVVSAIEKSDPGLYKHKFSLIRMLIMTTKKIPRGKAKAPKMVQPTSNFDIVTLKNHLEKAKINIRKLDTFDTNKYFEHPYFGPLKLKPTIRFLEIHTHHHLKIINDIVTKPKK
ncbi:DUF1569 domain-containing protein [Flavobacterium praedii]|uniref:DUF1569 domain-containing protein n=1 Tax=Flavobacterium praedii TaxID=3002900 RepID=UPI002481A492|nr:DUF1569 domain-containing protein [Flavobacterium praedii]